MLATWRNSCGSATNGGITRNGHRGTTINRSRCSDSEVSEATLNINKKISGIFLMFVTIILYTGCTRGFPGISALIPARITADALVNSQQLHDKEDDQTTDFLWLLQAFSLVDHANNQHMHSDMKNKKIPFFCILCLFLCSYMACL